MLSLFLGLRLVGVAAFVVVMCFDVVNDEWKKKKEEGGVFPEKSSEQ